MVIQYAIASTTGADDSSNIDYGLICHGGKVFASGAALEIAGSSEIQHSGVFMGLADGILPGEDGSECVEGVLNQLAETFRGVEDPDHYPLPDSTMKMEEGIKRGHELLLQLTETRDDDLEMKTCLAGAWVSQDTILYTSIGNTRIYRFSDGVLQLMTEDDTEVWELVNSGKVTPEQAHTYPGHKVLTQVLGGKKSQKPSIKIESQKIEPGDVFILCSDGLSDGVSDQNMEQLLSESVDDSGKVDPAVADKICRKAIERNEKDGCSLILFQMFPNRSKWSGIISAL